MGSRLDTMLTAALAVATLIVVSTAVAAVTPNPSAPSQVSCALSLTS